MEALGHNGSPEGWFDRAADAEVRVLRPDGTWYHCETHPLVTDPNHLQPWRFVAVDALAQVMVHVTKQSPRCFCPESHGS